MKENEKKQERWKFLPTGGASPATAPTFTPSSSVSTPVASLDDFRLLLPPPSPPLPLLPDDLVDLADLESLLPPDAVDLSDMVDPALLPTPTPLGTLRDARDLRSKLTSSGPVPAPAPWSDISEPRLDGELALPWEPEPPDMSEPRRDTDLGAWSSGKGSLYGLNN